MKCIDQGGCRVTRHNTGREHWRVAGVREREVNEEMDCKVVMSKRAVLRRRIWVGVKKSTPSGVTEFGKELECVLPEQAQPNHRHL